MSTDEKGDQDLWMEIPSYFYMALGRRGQEKITADQCFLDGCDNNNADDLVPLEMKTSFSDKKDDGSYTECKKIKVKCKKCNGVFYFALQTHYIPQNKTDDKKEVKPFMGLAYILDKDEKNLGQLGYF